jgi:hypothetical protein
MQIVEKRSAASSTRESYRVGILQGDTQGASSRGGLLTEAMAVMVVSTVIANRLSLTRLFSCCSFPSCLSAAREYIRNSSQSLLRYSADTKPMVNELIKIPQTAAHQGLAKRL